jgi:hypothetical protein
MGKGQRVTDPSDPAQDVEDFGRYLLSKFLDGRMINPSVEIELGNTSASLTFVHQV